MKYVERGVLLIFSLVVLFAMHQLIDRLFEAHEWKGLDASGWAAWVQAVGSIAALAIAIFIMSRQNAHSAKLVSDADRIATLRRARSVHAVLVRSVGQINGLYTLANTTAGTDPASLRQLDMELTNSIEIVEAIEKRLSEIPVYDLGAYKMSDGVMQITEALDSIRSTFSEVKRYPTDAGSDLVIRAMNYFQDIQKRGLRKFEAGMKELENP